MTPRIVQGVLRPIRTVERNGRAGRSRPIRALTAAVVCVAVAVAIAGTLLPGPAPDGGPLSPLAGVGAATALVAVGQLARLRFRLGRGAVSVSWGEAAFIIGFALAPPGWLPLATLAGAGGAWFLVSWVSEHRPRAEIVHLAASLTLGAAGAAVVAGAVAGNAAVASDRMHVGLVAGASTYLLITFSLAAVTLALHRDATPRQIVVRVLHAKLPMFVGNVLVGLFGLFVLVREPLWQLAFPPGLWLLQRT